jgi:hypothetical protein
MAGAAPPHQSVRMYRTFLVPSLFGLAPCRDYRVSPFAPESAKTRLCGSNPHLTVGGRYPLHCCMEPGLSSHRWLSPSASGHPTRFKEHQVQYQISELRSSARLTRASASLFISLGISTISTLPNPLKRFKARSQNLRISWSFTLYSPLSCLATS